MNSPDLPVLLAPTWHDETHSLYFVSFFTAGEQSSIFRYSELDGVLYGAYIEGVSAPSFIIPIDLKKSGRCWECEKCKNCENNCRKCYAPKRSIFTPELPNECDERFFAVGVDHDVLIIQWNGKSTKAFVVSKLLTLEPDVQLSRTNFGRADPKVTDTLHNHTNLEI